MHYLSTILQNLITTKISDAVRIITSKQWKFSQSDPVLIRQFSKKLHSNPVLIWPKMASVLICAQPCCVSGAWPLWLKYLTISMATRCNILGVVEHMLSRASARIPGLYNKYIALYNTDPFSSDTIDQWFLTFIRTRTPWLFIKFSPTLCLKSRVIGSNTISSQRI